MEHASVSRGGSTATQLAEPRAAGRVSTPRRGTPVLPARSAPPLPAPARPAPPTPARAHSAGISATARRAGSRAPVPSAGGSTQAPPAGGSATARVRRTRSKATCREGSSARPWLLLPVEGQEAEQPGREQLASASTASTPSHVPADEARPVRPARPAGATASAGRRTHLTARGRSLALLLLAALLFAAFSLGRVGTQASTTGAGTATRGATAGTADAAPAGEAASLHATTVQPGESLWGLARRVAPSNDTRDVIDQIRRLNNLRGSQLQAGQQLLLPVAAG